MGALEKHPKPGFLPRAVRRAAPLRSTPYWATTYGNHIDLIVHNHQTIALVETKQQFSLAIKATLIELCCLALEVLCDTRWNLRYS